MQHSKSHIVFLPGLLCDANLWKLMIDLSEQFPSTFIDFRGCQNLEEMLDKIKETPVARFHLVGFSMGGYIAQVFSSKFPQRVMSLSLIASTVGALSDESHRSRMQMIKLLQHSKYKGMSAKDVSKYVHESSLGKKEVVNTIIEMSQSYTSQMYVNQLLATIDRKDLASEIESLNIPILIVGGLEDRIVPQHTLTRFHEKLTNSRLEFIGDCGHYIPLERPAELVKTLESFLHSS